MNDNIKKADFICDCVKAVLSDGEPHRYREILNYRGCKTVRNPAVGVVTAINRRYYRKKHGVTIGVVPIKKGNIRCLKIRKNLLCGCIPIRWKR